MNHFAAPSFWERYENLPTSIRELADKNFKLLKTNPEHPSLHLKRVGKYRSVRVGRKYRAVAVELRSKKVCCGSGWAHTPSMTN